MIESTTHLSKPATKPKNFRWSSPTAGNFAFKSITRSEVAPPPPKEGPCLIKASTTLQTLVCILPKEVMTSGLSPSFMMAIKAGHSSWKRIYRTDVGLSSWYINNRSTAEYKLTKSPVNKTFFRILTFSNFWFPYLFYEWDQNWCLEEAYTSSYGMDILLTNSVETECSIVH